MWSIAGLRPAMLHMKACWKAGINRVCWRRRRPSAGDAFTQTRTILIVPHVIFWMKPLLVEKCHWMKRSLDEKFIGWDCYWMKVFWIKVSLDEIVFGWKCIPPISLSTFITSDVRSYIPSSIQNWYRGVQNLSKRQTVFFLPVNPMDKEHKDPRTIDFEAPRLARYMHTTWKKHQNTVYWVDIKLAQKKGLKFYQTRSNVIILYNTLPAYCIPKAVRMETGEVIYEKVHASSRPLPKISLKHDWMKELGSEVFRQAEDNQTLIQFIERGDLLWQNKRLVRVLRKSTHVFSLDCKNTNLFLNV